ncbi:MAG: EFR1 family ferrodoxin [Chloroflexota bacterium]
MIIKKISAVYFSPTGTTEKAISAFAEGTGIPLEKIDLTTPKARGSFSRTFPKDEMVVFGLPVYAGRLPKNIDDFFSGLKGDATPAVAAVTYGNREFDDALLELQLRLEERGFIVKAGVTFIGEHTFSRRIATGRPDASDLATVAGFGRQAAESIARDGHSILTLKGTYPFVAKGSDPANPFYPRIATAESCTRCGLCAENCPQGVIDKNDFKTIDYARCLHCLRCVKYCPASAKKATGEEYFKRLPQFETRLNSNRQEPELFLPR